MQYVINKGIAGLGNRLQSLGWALDTALKHDAKLVVDWEDSTWRLGFNDFFSLDGIDIAPLSEVPDDIDVSPETWRDKWMHRCGTKQGGKAMTYRIEPDAEAQVICVYKHAHSDELSRRIRPSPASQETIAANLNMMPSFNAYHIRNTDKQTSDWQEWIEEATNRQNVSKQPSLIATDSIEVEAAARDAGLVCVSWLIPPDAKGGVHHARCNDETKDAINLSAVVDMWLCVHAETFTACCPSSTFSQFVERMRKVKER